MKRCRCRSRLLPTTRIGTSLLLPSLQAHVRDGRWKMNKRNREVQKSQLSDWCHSCQGVRKMPVSSFPVRSEVCGGGREDYSSQTRGASHRTLQRLLYSIIVSVNRKPEICIDGRFKNHAINPNHIQRDTLKGPLREILEKRSE